MFQTRISGSRVLLCTRYITRDLSLSLASKDRTMLGRFKRDGLLLNIHFIPEAYNEHEGFVVAMFRVLETLGIPIRLQVHVSAE